MQEQVTPLMQQYFAIKNQHPETILLFQVGDFYELFFDDAKQAAATLGIALTARGKNKGEPIPLCGVPVHALDYYLVKLVKAGFKVAICDQLEPAVPGKVVERGIKQVLTPGTLTDTKLLDEKSASYLLSFFPMHDSWGLLFGELLTAQLYATILPASSEKKLESELVRFFPDEIVIPHSSIAKSYQPYFKQRGYFTTMIETPAYDSEQARLADQWLQAQLRGVAAQKVYENQSLKNAITLFHEYVRKNQSSALEQFKSIQFYEPDDFLILDGATQRNLELVKNVHDGSSKNTLFAVVDRAVTAMGSRMIKKWLLRPLVNREHIEQRHDSVELLVTDQSLSFKIEHLLSQMGDIERMVGRVALMRATTHDYIQLSQALALVPHIKSLLDTRRHIRLIGAIADSIADFSAIERLLFAALNTDLSKPWIIKPGFDLPLDQVRDLAEHANAKILAFEQQEQQKTGISSLKVGYNSAHGYYIEVTKTNLGSVPDYYLRHQTLVGRERFTTPELRALQDDIMNAKNQIEILEKAAFDKIKLEVLSHIAALRKLAHALAHLDALFGFSKVAYDRGYIRPNFVDSRDIVIINGRHPVVEQALDHNFIPNSTELTDQESMWIITGPNMGGKSTYLRQVAQICILAQCGSLVPAAQAQLPILDRVFTRIGAGDNVAEGKSTFLVEMEETAAICTQATDKSLVILDEVGRGTSTFDGLAIAQAVVEYIATQVKARCLFATHYHELTLLKDQIPGISSYYAACKKTPQGIVFLYQILQGVADGSFGVEVAKLAHLPAQVIARAEQILQVLSQTEMGHQQAVAHTDLQQAIELHTVRAQLHKLTQENAQLQARLADQTQLISSLKNLFMQGDRQ